MLGTGSYAESIVRESIKVGNYSSIAANVTFCEKQDNHLCVSNRKCVYTTNWGQPEPDKDIQIGNDVWIGRNVLILPAIKINDGAIIGAGTVVTKDVPPYAVVVGNTGRIVRYRFTKRQIEKLLKLKWWDWDKNVIQGAKMQGDFEDIDKFLELYG